MKYRAAAKKLKALGCEELQRHGAGSHRVWLNPTNGHIVPLPDWGAKDLKLGTLRATIRQLGLDWQEFLKKQPNGFNLPVPLRTRKKQRIRRAVHGGIQPGLHAAACGQ